MINDRPNQADIARLNRGLAIRRRRAKKQNDIMNDKRMETCVS